MKRGLHVSLVVFFVIVPFTPVDGGEKVIDEIIILPANTTRVFSFATHEDSARMLFSVWLRNGTEIGISVLDESNYLKFSNSQEFDSYYAVERITAVGRTIPLGNKGVYYLILNNYYSGTTEEVSVSVEILPSETEDQTVKWINLILSYISFPVFLGLLGTLIGTSFWVWVTRRRKHSSSYK